ncbi:MAG: nucleoside hydrolase [Clostridia bacterium]|nr:nucleoside hydrolase [Clostridia bacterium]
MTSRRAVIFDTDWWTDCDDCVALKLLLNSEEVELKGININAFMEISPYSVETFLSQYGRGNIPVSVDKNALDYPDVPVNSYQKKIIDTFSKGEYKSADNYETSVKFYRRLLSSLNEKADIVAVGFQNSIADLLMSEGDEFSPLNGIELCKEKVGKLWAMAGRWDKDGSKEYNVANTARSVKSAKIVFENFPCPITYLGFEVGESVITGGTEVIGDENDALAVAMKAHGSEKGRNSWDPMTALLAAIGDEEKAGYETVYGRIIFDDEGRNYFSPDSTSDRCYVTKKYDDSFYADAINRRISVDKIHQ